MVKVIACANQKGGVGKTTTCINLAASLTAAKRKVLVVDLDPQGNATMGSGINKLSLEHSITNLLLGEAVIGEVILHTEPGEYDLIPANGELSATEVALFRTKDREFRLRRELDKVKACYDYVLIDCPPSLNIVTLNGLVAADSVLITMQCEYFALEGLSSLMDTINQLQRSANPKLELEGILRTMYDNRNCLSQEVSSQLSQHFKEKLYRTIIPRNIRLAEAPSFGAPVLHYDKRSAGAQAYLAFAGEFLQRQKEKQVEEKQLAIE